MRWRGSLEVTTAGSGPASHRGRCGWGQECGSDISFNMIPAQEALARLREGNRRFVASGAIAATLDELRQPQGHESPNLRAIVDRIRPTIEPLLRTPAAKDPTALVEEATRANIRASVHHLRHGSALLERRIERDGLLIVGAEYCVETGTVEFFDD